MTEVPIIQKPVQWFAEQINGLVSIYKDLRHERIRVMGGFQTILSDFRYGCNTNKFIRKFMKTTNNVAFHRKEI